MKRKFIFFICLSLFSVALFAQRMEESSLVVMYPVCENISAPDQNWLPGSIQDRFESNFLKLSKFKLINSANEKEIRYLQKKYESAFYDEKTSLEQGKLSGARYALFTTVRKTGRYYSLSAKFTDLQSGQNLSSCVKQGIPSLENLCVLGGCTVDIVTLELFSQLKINLSASQKYELQYGNENLTYDEQFENARQEEIQFKNQIAKYDAEIQTLKKSSEVDAISQIARINTQKAIAEEKMKAAKLQSERLSEEKQRKLQDQKHDLERSINQKKKRDELIEQVNKKSQILRNLKSSNASPFAQIMILENKKKALSEIYAELNKRIDEIEKDALEEYNSLHESILTAPYRNAEVSNGKPTSDALLRRKNEIEENRIRIENQTQKQIFELEKQVKKELNQLEKEIQSDKKRLSSVKKSSSLSDDLKISVGGYDAEKQSWIVYVYFYLGSNLVYKTSVDLKYSDLVGKVVDVTTATKTEYDFYMDNVDMYSSLFARGEQLVYGEIFYTIEPDKNIDSRYNFSFKTLNFYDVLTGKRISSPKILETKSSFTFLSTNFSSEVKKKVFHIKSDDEIEKEMIAQKEKLKKEKAVQERKIQTENTISNFSNYLDKSARYAVDCTIAVNYIPGYHNGVGVEEIVGFDIPFWKNLFCGGKIGYLVNSEYDYTSKYTDHIFHELSSEFLMLAELGLSFNLTENKKSSFLNDTFPFDFYTSFAFGGCIGDYYDLMMRASAGISWFMLKAEYNYSYLISYEKGFHSFCLVLGFYWHHEKKHR